MSIVVWNPLLFFWLTRKQKRGNLGGILHTSEILTSLASRVHSLRSTGRNSVLNMESTRLVILYMRRHVLTGIFQDQKERQFRHTKLHHKFYSAQTSSCEYSRKRKGSTSTCRKDRKCIHALIISLP